MRKNYGYGSYRGRSSTRNLLKALAILLAVILVMAVAGLLLLEPYWVISAEGARLRLPWTEPEPTSPMTPAPSEPLVIVTPEPVRSEPLHALLLPQEALTDGSAAARLEEGGANAALFDMKRDDGALAFVSASGPAAAAGVNPAAEGRNGAILALNETEDLYTVARVACFRDNTLPKVRNTMAIRSPVGNWRDASGSRWLSPSSADARQYLTDLCLELAGLGFDEILLDYAAYPVNGDLSYIVQNDAYDPAALPATVAGFYSALAETLRAAFPDVKLSVVADPAALVRNSDSPSGQRLDMAAVMDRIWLRGSGEEWDALGQLLEESGLDDSSVCLVSLGERPGAEARSWAVWP